MNAPHCRFEDRLAGRALKLTGFLRRIEARREDEVDPALAAIARARADGCWVALLLNYDLGEWLLPGLRAVPNPSPGAAADAAADAARRASSAPRLTALVFDGVRQEKPWTAPDDNAVGAVLSVKPRVGAAEYGNAVRAIRGMIAAGDLYQVNFTLPMDVRTKGDPETLYRRLANRHPSAHAAFIEDGGRTILSFSPELFLRREGDRLSARPMKGTAPRGATPAEDRANGERLLASEKNRAENLMIVDLLRNDLSRMAQTRAVSVPALFTLERYPSLFTLTSTVTARISGPVDLRDMLGAAFPCGSITGAPKLAAMRAIAALEPFPRGLYCGSIGWLAPDGDMSLNVAIRTLVLQADGTGVYGAGGGIVYDSDPLEEWRECLLKTKMLGREALPVP